MMILKFEKSGGRETKRRAPVVAVALAAMALLFAMPAGARDDWSNRSPSSSPSLRTGSRMANIITTETFNGILLFDGYTGASETWVYEAWGNTWTQITGSAENPTARNDHALAELPGAQVLLFGGYDSDYNGETWVYDNTTGQWTNKNPGGSTPSPRWGHDMAWISDDQVLLFGGYDSDGYKGDTWVYDLGDNEWTNKSPGGSTPSVRRYHAMESLDDNNRVLLFGGQGSVGSGRETWEYDLSSNQWTQFYPSTHPPSRLAHSMALLTDSNEVILYGGAGGYRDTWAYDPSTHEWTELSPSTVPPAAEYDTMANAGESGVVLFLEEAGAMETWLYSAPTLVELVSFVAESGLEGATLSWETATEIDCAGFRVWRCDSAGGDCEIVTDDLIDAQGDEVTGASYSFEDHSADPGTFYRYRLEDLEYSGKSTFHDTTARFVQLVAGWNTIDGPALAGQPVADALASIEGRYAAVWTLARDGWKMYDPAHPALGDMEAFEAGSECWIYMYEAGTLALQ